MRIQLSKIVKATGKRNVKTTERKNCMFFKKKGWGNILNKKNTVFKVNYTIVTTSQLTFFYFLIFFMAFQNMTLRLYNKHYTNVNFQFKCKYQFVNFIIFYFFSLLLAFDDSQNIFQDSIVKQVFFLKKGICFSEYSVFKEKSLRVLIFLQYFFLLLFSLSL